MMNIDANNESCNIASYTAIFIISILINDNEYEYDTYNRF